MTVNLTTLDNGFRIVTENMPSLHSASIGIWVDAGGRHERLEQNGIAHFLEHMAFKGTHTRSALDIAEVLENVGGYLNAYTSREMTAYYARVLENDVDLAFDVISDIVLNSVFDAGELETERGVILQEIGQTLDTPDDVIFDWLQEVAFPDQPIGRSILGPSERVSNFQRDDLHNFVAEHYGPERMVLSAAGAVDHDALVNMAQNAFGALKRQTPAKIDLARFQGGEIRQEKPLEQAHFAMALETVGYRHDDIYASQIYAITMGGGMSSRLFQEAREKRGLCYSIHASVGGFVETGLMTIYAGTSADDVAGLADLVGDELNRAARDLTAEEVARAAAQLKAGLLMSMERPSSRCERLARMVSIWDRVPSLEEVIARVDAVGVGEARAFAQHVAENAQPALALYGPVANAPDAGSLAARIAA